METLKNIKNNLFNTQVGVASVMFGIALMICAAMLANGIGNIKRANNTIAVTGSAEKMVKSDNAKLTFSISRRVNGTDLSGGYKLLNSDVDYVKAYLEDKGTKEDNITIEGSKSSELCAMNTRTQYPYADCSLGVIGYNLTQNIYVNIKDIEVASDISANAPTSMAARPTVSLSNTEYFYDKLKDDRVELMSMATKNAMERAKAVAMAGNSALGAIVEASTGVIQVTAPNSVDVSDYGTYDTSTVDKKVTAVVRVSFEVK